MSLNIQNINNIDNKQHKTNQKWKKNIVETIMLHTPLCEETQRIFNPRNVTNLNKDLDIKQTERNYEQSKNKKIIWLTQSNGQKSEKDSNWSINFQSSHKEHIDQIYSILQSYHLTEVFQVFQELRAIISQEIYQSNASNRYKIDLIQAIQTFKTKLNFDKSQQSYNSLMQNNSQEQLKQMVKQIVGLRAENACLRHKIQQICNQFQSQQVQNIQLNNSILNNSISFHSYNSTDSYDISNQSLQITLQKELIRPFFITKQIMEESTLGLMSDSGQKLRQLQSSVNCINSFAIIANNQQTQTEQNVFTIDSSLQHKWIQVIQYYVKEIKKLFKLYVGAVNLALINNEHQLKQFKSLLSTIHAYKSNPNQGNTEQFLQQSKHFISFVTHISVKIDQIIEKQFNELSIKLN